MEKVFDMLRETIESLVRQRKSNDEIESAVASFRSDHTPPPGTIAFATNFPSRLVIKAVAHVLAPDFQVVSDIAQRKLVATLRRDYSTKPLWLDAVQSARRDWSFQVRIEAQVDRSGLASLTIRPAFGPYVRFVESETLKHLNSIPKPDVEVERLAESALAQSTVQSSARDSVLAPGETLKGPYAGTLRDYSRCAIEGEVTDLLSGEGGVLPLGRYAFDHPRLGFQLGSPLFLSPLPAPRGADGVRLETRRALREHQGCVICAPPNSGKTELIVRWARAANAAGYNLFIVDVKGNLLPKLQDGYDWKGDLFHLTTDPLVSPGDASATPCHALNVLAGIDPRSRLSIRYVQQLAEALLPGEGLEQGETRVWRRNWLTWLGALIHIALLYDFYYPWTNRDVDLDDVFQLASDESLLFKKLRAIDEKEQSYLNSRPSLPIVEPDVRTWFGDIAVLVSQVDVVPETPERSGMRGARAEYSYRWLTEQIVSALRPFRRTGLLYDKVSGWRDLPHFSLDCLTGLDAKLKPVTGRQATVVIAAREQELDDAKTLLTLAIIKLEQALYDRMRYAGTGLLKPVVLLLDETRRIRNFKVNDYVSYAREAEAGCVLVYQSLEQIGEEKAVRQLLEMVGCQIYLGSVTGATAKNFIDFLPSRDRPSFSITTGGGEGSAGLQISQQSIPFFSTADLHALPVGDYPAVVYLRDQPRRAPILVTMSRWHLDPRPASARA
jgi:hypothetical protein